MKYSLFLAAALCSCAVGLAVAASSPGVLTGSFIVSGKTVIDPPESEPRNTHLQLFLSGASAKALYAAMSVKPVEDQCLMDGSVTKFFGGTECTMHKGGKEYTCSLAINIKSQRVESAYAC